MPRPLKVVLIVLGALIGTLLAMGIVGAVLIETGVIEDNTATVEQPAATAAPTTTTTPAPTTTRHATTTTRPSGTTTLPATPEALMSLEECLEWEWAESDIIYGIGDSLGEMAAAMAIGDADMAHSWYWHAKGQREVLYFDEWLIECGHWNPDGAAIAAADYEAAEEGWRTVERICRDVLEPLGLSC